MPHSKQAIRGPVVRFANALSPMHILDVHLHKGRKNNNPLVKQSGGKRCLAGFVYITGRKRQVYSRL